MSADVTAVRTSTGWGLLIENGRTVVDIIVPKGAFTDAERVAYNVAHALNHYTKAKAAEKDTAAAVEAAMVRDLQAAGFEVDAYGRAIKVTA